MLFAQDLNDTMNTILRGAVSDVPPVMATTSMSTAEMLPTMTVPVQAPMTMVPVHAQTTDGNISEYLDNSPDINVPDADATLKNLWGTESVERVIFADGSAGGDARQSATTMVTLGFSPHEMYTSRMSNSVLGIVSGATEASCPVMEGVTLTYNSESGMCTGSSSTNIETVRLPVCSESERLVFVSADADAMTLNALCFDASA
jgi:hypothetical protein